MKFELHEWPIEGFGQYLLFNPRAPQDRIHLYQKAFKEYFEKNPSSAESNERIFGLLTSGTTASGVDDFKIIVLTAAAIECSAKSVNQFIEASVDDVWGLALPTFHIGGLSILARARLSGSSVLAYSQEWNPSIFARFLEQNKITLTSLVPTQLFDLIKLNIRSPSNLRVAFVGGGAMSSELFESAKGLGWPLIATYGMTELCSQVACSSFQSGGSRTPDLYVLPHVEVKTSLDQKLLLQSKSQLLAQILYRDSKVQIESYHSADWFTSEDIVELKVEIDSYGAKKTRIVPLGRGSDFLKIKGENVDLKKLRSIWEQICQDSSLLSSSFLIAIPDARDGFKVCIALEGTVKDEAWENSDVMNVRYQSYLSHYNEKVMPYERVLEYKVVPKIPRSELGKVLISNLVRQILGEV